jgi:hypothetical protein
MIFTLGALFVFHFLSMTLICAPAEALKEWLIEHNQPGHVRSSLRDSPFRIL